jgi:hypothetical protein
LPKDLRVLERELQDAIREMDSLRASHPDIDVPTIQMPDSFGVISMFLKAASEGKLLELPESCAALLRGQWTQQSVQELVDRTVWEQAKTRVEMDPSFALWKQDDRISAKSAEPRERLFKEKRPNLHIHTPFEVASPDGLYPLLLVTLRNAYQHALLASIDPDIAVPGQVAIEYSRSNDSELVRVLNTGRPDVQGSRQDGWERDLETFEGLTSGWHVRQHGDGSFSEYMGQNEWVTEIGRVSC